jgi:hypothetical protein
MSNQNTCRPLTIGGITCLYIEAISKNHSPVVYELVSRHHHQVFFIDQFIETISLNQFLINHNGSKQSLREVTFSELMNIMHCGQL